MRVRVRKERVILGNQIRVILNNRTVEYQLSHINTLTHTHTHTRIHTHTYTYTHTHPHINTHTHTHARTHTHTVNQSSPQQSCPVLHKNQLKYYTLRHWARHHVYSFAQGPAPHQTTCHAHK